VDDVALMRGAIRGMLEALGDKHTAYMDPEQHRVSQMPMDGEYEGIGAWVDTTGEYLVIISPMPGSPAEKAGVKANDMIIAVDGEDMTGIDGNLVLRASWPGQYGCNPDHPAPGAGRTDRYHHHPREDHWYPVSPAQDAGK
jgi:C-terminal processing protease CtpA/Prc